MPLLSEAKALFAGDLPAKKVYLGDALVWSSAFTPNSIPGLTLWIDAQQQVDSDGVRVMAVKDHSPAKRTLVAQPGKEPVYRANFAGKPAFEWLNDGTAYGLECGQWNPGSVGLTFVFVGFLTGGTYPMMVVWGTDGDGFEMRHNDKQETVLRYSSHGIVWTHPEPSSGGKDYMFSLRVDRTDSDAWTNRVMASGGTPAMPNIDQMLYAGRRELGYPFIGAMREVLVYAGPVSDADMTKLFDYLTSKWALTF